jgi:hypothetical protein
MRAHSAFLKGEALTAADRGETVVVDVSVEPNYEPTMLKAMLGQSSHD